MIVAPGIAMQFGANGCGKCTFMKILGGEVEPSAGTVAIDFHECVGRLGG